MSELGRSECGESGWGGYKTQYLWFVLIGSPSGFVAGCQGSRPRKDKGDCVIIELDSCQRLYDLIYFNEVIVRHRLVLCVMLRLA